MDQRRTYSATIILLSALGLLSSLPAFAEYQEVHPCDEVAAHPSDKQKWGKGLTDQDLSPPRAIKLCNDALKQYPDTPRFHFQLGRALWLSQKFDEAVSHFAAAAEKGHAAAHAFLGDAYQTGLGGLGTNQERAIQSYEVAARGGFDPAYDALTRAQKSREKATFRADGFQIPEIVTALYYGDFSEVNSALTNQSLKYQRTLYLNEFHKYFAEPETQYAQANLGQNPASCRQMYDPDLSRIMVNDVVTRSNPLGQTLNEQMENMARSLGSIMDDMRSGGPGALTDRVMNIEVTQQQGRQDAMHLIATYGCDSEIAKQMYRNIRPFLVGGEGIAPIIDPRMAAYLTDGCQTSGMKATFCKCMLNSILKSNLAADDQELLAANFSPARMERMKEKYPGFRDHSKACF